LPLNLNENNISFLLIYFKDTAHYKEVGKDMGVYNHCLSVSRPRIMRQVRVSILVSSFHGSNWQRYGDPNSPIGCPRAGRHPLRWLYPGWKVHPTRGRLGGTRPFPWGSSLVFKIPSIKINLS